MTVLVEIVQEGLRGLRLGVPTKRTLAATMLDSRTSLPLLRSCSVSPTFIRGGIVDY